MKNKRRKRAARWLLFIPHPVKVSFLFLKEKKEQNIPFLFPKEKKEQEKTRAYANWRRPMYWAWGDVQGSHYGRPARLPQDIAYFP